MNKFEFLEETIKQLGLSCREVIDYLSKNGASVSVDTVDITQVKPGMFWYEDNTFSTEFVFTKSIKAIVELVDDGVIYGDLTALELFDIKEQKLPWNDAKRFIEEFPYPCQENEKIVWYKKDQLEKVCSTYEPVKEAFCKIGKSFRKGFYCSSTEYYATHAWGVNFSNGGRYNQHKDYNYYVRPVLSLDTRCLV